MKPWFASSLRGKLLAVMMLATLVAVVVALGAMIAYDLRAYHQDWVREVDTRTELLARTTATALAFDDARVARENLGVLRFQPRVRAAAVYDASGALFATYMAEGVTADFPALPGAEGVRADGARVVAFRRIVDNGEILGTMYVRADYELVDRLVSYAGIALIVALFAMAAAWGVATWLRQIVLRPIIAVGDAAREVVERADYSRRVDQQRDDELGALVTAFNEMMREIERRTDALEDSNREKAHEVEERRAAQQEVMRLNAGLEQRVRDRTAALEHSNRELALASAAAEQANRAKSEFLSNMSHELRTPLNAIIGFGKVLAGAAPQGLTDERRQAFVGHIVTAGEHLLTLIDDILNLAQIEAGKLSLSIEPVALGELLDECRTMAETLAQARGIRLLFPAAPQAMVEADRRRLKQVLLNLLSNAVKYNRESGSVIVDFSRTSAHRLRITVQDTGIGMRPDQLKALFQPFNRLGQEGGAQQGTGIGLVVTRHLVELMGGELGVSSTAGAGSLFWVELRAHPDAPPRLPPRVDDVPAAGSEVGAGGEPPAEPAATVLCVEDNPSSLELIRVVLDARPGVRLLTASDGHAGVELARKHLPDVILMDNNMPVLSGSEAQAILRQDPRTAHIPVIAISANAMPGAAARSLAAGFYRYLTKPVDFAALAEALDSALAAKSSRPR